MSDLADILEYRKKLDQDHRRVAMAEGALKQVLLRLRKEYGCKTIEQARKVYKTLQQKHTNKERLAETKLKEFEEKWKEHL